MATAGNPLVPQGTLNRVKGTVSVVSIPKLNVIASFLGKDGISLSFDGAAATILPTMAGTVISNEPYIMCSISINLLKTQGLAALYKAQMEDTCVLGDVVVTPDSSTLPLKLLLFVLVDGWSLVVQSLMQSFG